MNNRVIKFKQIILAAADLLLMQGALLVALMIRYKTLDIGPYWSTHRVAFGIVFALWVIIFFINGLYDIRKAKNSIRFFQNLLISFIANFFVGLMFFYFVPAFRITPKTNLVLTVLLSIVLISLWRALFNHSLGPKLLRRTILFLGFHPRVEDLVTSFAKDPQLGFTTAAIMEPEQHLIPHHISSSVQLFSDPMRIRSVVDIKEIHTVVIAPHLARAGELEKELYELLFWRVEMADLATFYEHITGRVNADMVNESWFWQNLRESRKQYYDALRTVADVGFAIALGLLLLILLPFVAIAILAESGRPLFIKQKRVGLHNKPFTIYKLRTMYAKGKDGLAEESGPQFASANDTRITKVGKWLRKLRIDELPQSWNILKREMNLIGPRPERAAFVDQLQSRMPYYSIRHLIRPGLTGWAQVSYRYGATLEENLVKLEYDLYYMKYRSLLMDIVIVLKTVHIIAKAMGR